MRENCNVRRQPSFLPSLKVQGVEMEKSHLGTRKAEARFNLLKQEGNDLVKRGEFEKALEKYSECIALKPTECSVYTNRDRKLIFTP
ncbi:hypothetical protein QTP86_010861 [Hemibagrus guttatus]|nr:hypothetical protein QTP86_010861 [Hemibagrus guttatus]